MTPPFVFEADDLNFQDLVLSRSVEVPVLIDCWAEWCEPCKTLGPTLERIAQNYKGRFELAKVNIDHAQQVASALRIQSVPFMMLFMNGRPVDALVGNVPESEITAFLDRHLPPDESDPFEAAEEAFKAHQLEEAARLYDLSLIDHPTRVEAMIGRARVDLALGQLDQAASILEQVPPEHPLAQTAERLKKVFQFAEFAGDETILQAKIEGDPQSVELWYQLGATLAIQGAFEGASEAFLKVLTLDRTYRDDGGRQALLALFDALGGEGEVVSRFRRRMASILF
jgi:putative thioredoxin